MNILIFVRENKKIFFYLFIILYINYNYNCKVFLIILYMIFNVKFF